MSPVCKSAYVFLITVSYPHLPQRARAESRAAPVHVPTWTGRFGNKTGGAGGRFGRVANDKLAAIAKTDARVSVSGNRNENARPASPGKMPSSIKCVAFVL